MKKGGSSAKGSTFEREICKKLSQWWTQESAELRDDVFWRSSQSGGRATQRAKSGKQTAGSYGDITALDPIGKPLLDLFCFELKRGYGKWCILDALEKKSTAKRLTTVEEFWKQAKASAAQAGGPYPAVIFRRDQKQPCIVVPDVVRCKAAKFDGTYFHPFIKMLLLTEWVSVFLLDDFLDWLSPSTIGAMQK